MQIITCDEEQLAVDVVKFLGGYELSVVEKSLICLVPPAVPSLRHKPVNEVKNTTPLTFVSCSG